MPARFIPAYAGRDAPCYNGKRRERVSIHAPTRGATGVEVRLCADISVSIHAPTRGATVTT